MAMTLMADARLLTERSCGAARGRDGTTRLFDARFEGGLEAGGDRRVVAAGAERGVPLRIGEPRHEVAGPSCVLGDIVRVGRAWRAQLGLTAGPV